MQSLRHQALTLLARREHAAEELRRKLRAKRGRDVEDEIATLLASLMAEGLQSDERFADSYTRARIGAGFGPLRIGQELKARGVCQDQINQCLAQYDEHWPDNLQAIWKKKYHCRMPANPKEYAKQHRFLQARGFSPRMIASFLNIKQHSEETGEIFTSD